MNWLIVDEIIKNALKEDIPSEDITTTPLVTENSLCSVNLISKEDGICLLYTSDAADEG